MDPDKRQRLRKNHRFLKENLRIQPILDKLYEKGVLMDDDTDVIRSKTVTADQIQEFLDYLKRSGNKGYAAFCESLRELQPDILKVLDETTIDRETLGEVSDSHIFFDPSEDFELKGLIDQLTTENKISPEQLERLKHFVMDENGCPEEIIEKKDTPQKFFRHLMKTRLITRYNLAFLQSLLWRLGNTAMCREVANFARQSHQRPIHFYTPRNTAENGYSFGKFHIKGDLENFKGITIEDICLRVARYLGVPQSYVIPAGVEPSESLLLTIMLHNDALLVLKAVENLSWLTDLGVDYVIYDEIKVEIEGGSNISQQDTTDLQVLEKELKRKLESEQHLKQCLYDEQVSNEILKDLHTEQQERLKRSKEMVHNLNIWYTRIFALLLVSFHFIAELIKERRGLSGQGSRFLLHAQYQYFAALEKAKRCCTDQTSLLELVEATTALRMSSERREIETMNNLAFSAMMFLQHNFNEALTRRMTEAAFGISQPKTPTVDEVRQNSLSLELIFGMKQLEPILQEIVTDVANRLDDTNRLKVCRAFNVPETLLTPDLKHLIFNYVIFSELEKLGKRSGTNEDIERFMKAALKEAGRKDLWNAFKAQNDHRLQIQADQRDRLSKKDTDINDRLDKIEKMMQTMVGQNLMGSMGVKQPGNFPDIFGSLFKGAGAQFPAPFTQQQV